MLRILFIFGILITLLGCLSQSVGKIPPPVKGQSPLKEAIALGNAGEQQEKNQRYDEALRFTRQAIFKTQAAQINESNSALAWLIRWHWQLGRILQAQGQRNAAIDAYQQALQILVPENEKAFQWKTEGEGNTSSVVLYKELRQMFLQLADLLLTTTQADQSVDLNLVRETIEKLKIVGLETYFTECLTNKVKKPIEQLAPETAVIYPILLPERLELLASFQVRGEMVIFRETVAINEKTIKAAVENFLKQIKKGRYNPENKEYLNDAQRLYRWLIAPLLPLLEQHDIHTLVFVPEDILNALPFAALHDGKDFIIQKFAVAITPTLNLTESVQTEKLSPSKTKVLLNALTEAVQNYPQLPYVPKEIQTVEKWYHPDTLLDEEFTSENFRKNLEKSRYDLIHIISHAEFAENVDESFILTHDGQLTLKDLQEGIESHQHQQPVELLILSACNTAKGDQGWTALGLSGIALKAGTRSALATLWKVDDRATYHLINKFYFNLNSPPNKLSNVQALQATQQDFLELKYFHHPFYWASLALIGNWL